MPAQAVVDEALGEFDEEVALHSSLGLLDIRPAEAETALCLRKDNLQPRKRRTRHQAVNAEVSK